MITLLLAVAVGVVLGRLSPLLGDLFRPTAKAGWWRKK